MYASDRTHDGPQTAADGSDSASSRPRRNKHRPRGPRTSTHEKTPIAPSIADEARITDRDDEDDDGNDSSRRSGHDNRGTRAKRHPLSQEHAVVNEISSDEHSEPDEDVITADPRYPWLRPVNVFATMTNLVAIVLFLLEFLMLIFAAVTCINQKRAFEARGVVVIMCTIGIFQLAFKTLYFTTTALFDREIRDSPPDRKLNEPELEDRKRFLRLPVFIDTLFFVAFTAHAYVRYFPSDPESGG